jgi:hypothetical protein
VRPSPVHVGGPYQGRRADLVGVPAPVAALPPDSGPGRAASPDTVRDLRFATPRDGYAFGGGLWTTHDGARTWHRLAVGAVSDLATDGRTVYAVVADCGRSRRPCDALRLLASPAGRDDFRPVGVRADGPADQATVSTGSGLVAATLGAAVFVADGAGRWRRAGNPCPAALAGVVAAASGGTLVAFCAEGAAGSLYLTARRSANRGRTWTAPSAPVRTRTGQVTVTAGSAAMLAVAASNPDLGGSLQTSRNGGATWTAAALARGGDGYRYVGARSDTSLVALASPPAAVVWTTSTAGRTWTRLPIR